MSGRSSRGATVKLAAWLLVAMLVVVSRSSQAKESNETIRASTGPDTNQRQSGASAEGHSTEVPPASDGQAGDSLRGQPIDSAVNGTQSVSTDTPRSKAPPLAREKEFKEQVVERKLEKVTGSLGQGKRVGQSSSIVSAGRGLALLIDLNEADALTSLGFGHELHTCNSLDGYTTQLVRMVNPHLERSKLRKYPVVLYTGQGTSPAVFLAGSLNFASGDGFAQNWRSAEREHHQDELLVGDIHHEATKSRGNRSLAIVLSNIGFDVWLVPTRGVDAQNRARSSSAAVVKMTHHHHHHHKLGHDSTKSNSTRKQEVRRSPDATNNLEAKVAEVKQLVKEIEVKNKPKFKSIASDNHKSEFDIDLSKFDLVAKLRQLLKEQATKSYWSFSSDEIIDTEFEQQIECVRSHSRAQKVSLVSYSNGGFVTFGFMARQPHYAQQRLDVVLNLAPAVFVDKFNLPLSFAGLASNLNLFDEPFPSEQLGELGRMLCRNEQIRSSACKLLLEQLYGPSKLLAGGSEAELELMFERYLARPASARALRQSLQVAYEGKMQEYDYGLLGNFIFYNQPKAPSYDLQRVNHERLFVMSGEQDAIVDRNSLVQLVGSIGCKPLAWLKVAHHNHFDLVVGHDNDEQVNWPLTRILIDRDLELDYYRDEPEDEGGHQEEEDDESDSTYGNYGGDEGDQQRQKNDSYEVGADDDTQGSYKSPVVDLHHHRQQFFHLRRDEYEGHTTTPAEKKNYDEGDDRQTEQSAERPVLAPNGGPALKAGSSLQTPPANRTDGLQLVSTPKTTLEAPPKVVAVNSSASERASAPCSGRVV